MEMVLATAVVIVATTNIAMFFSSAEGKGIKDSAAWVLLVVSGYVVHFLGENPGAMTAQELLSFMFSVEMVAAVLLLSYPFDFKK